MKHLARTKLLLFLLIGLLLGACGQEQQAVTPTAAGQNNLTPVVASSELVVGLNRLPLGVIKNGAPLNEPQLKPHLRFYYLGEGSNTGEVRGEADAIYRGQGLPVGLYVAYINLDMAGPWNMEVRLDQADGTSQVSRVRIEVAAESTTPQVGSAAIASQNLSLKDGPTLPS